MDISKEYIQEQLNQFIETAQTSRRALCIEAASTVLGFAGAFVSMAAEKSIPTVILGAIGFGSAMTGLANLEYQDAIRPVFPKNDENPGTHVPQKRTPEQ